MKRKGALRCALALLVVLSAAPEVRAAAPVLNDALTGEASQSRQFFDGTAPAGGGSADTPADGGFSGTPAAPLAKSSARPKSPDAAVVPSPASAREKKQQSLERLEDRLFTISLWMYHASWAADTFLTGFGISQGRGFETDHLNTLFGNRNVAGVVGSLAVIHVIAAAAAMYLHHKAKKHHGLSRTLLECAAIGINIFGTVQHVIGIMSWVKIL